MFEKKCLQTRRGTKSSVTVMHLCTQKHRPFDPFQSARDQISHRTAVLYLTQHSPNIEFTVTCSNQAKAKVDPHSTTSSASSTIDINSAELQEAPGHGMLGRRQLGRGEHLHDLAVDHEAHQVRDPLDLLHAVRHHHRGEPPRLLQPHDRLLDVLSRYRVQRARRLIQQEHLRRQQSTEFPERVSEIAENCSEISGEWIHHKGKTQQYKITRRTSGSLARVRAKATRCPWPTESSDASLEDRAGSRSDRLSRFFTSASVSFLPSSCGPYRTLSATVPAKVHEEIEQIQRFLFFQI